jgi:hypothetical protein
MNKLKLFIYCLLFIINGTTLSAETVVKKEKTIWIEAESFQSTNFDPGLMSMPQKNGASGGLYLRLYTKKSSDQPFFVNYHFTALAKGRYYLWISSTPQNTGWASFLYYSIDNTPFAETKQRPSLGFPYGSDNWFSWTQIGTPNLEAGNHSLRLEVRHQRKDDSLYVAFLDAIVLTTDSTFRPTGNHPKYSPQPEWSPEHVSNIEHSLYEKKMKATKEDIGPKVAAEVMRKIMARPLPDSVHRSVDRRFGVHGMEAPFVLFGVNEKQTSLAFELLARTGVQTFRTAESCWHRLGENFDDFKELDYQVANAKKYGQTFMFTVGYPPSPFSVNEGLSACLPKHYPLFQNYLNRLFNRYKDDHIIDYAELGNEVDAPHVWWRNSTPKMYVDEMRILNKAVKGVDPDIQIAAFAATYSRNEKERPQNGGRPFVRECFNLGIDKYVDAYSLHYTAYTSERDFPQFFHRELNRIGSPIKPLINSEESMTVEPWEVVKCFARDFFLYGMKRVDYFLARDFFEAGTLMHTGLFDMKWNPKLRLLAYAMSVDAMRDRHLVGIAQPVPGIEAYILKYNDDFGQGKSPYSIVLWKEDTTQSSIELVSGFKSVSSAVSWRLDSVKFDTKNPSFKISSEPIVVFANELPEWTLYTPEQWLKAIDEKKEDKEFFPPIPGF